MGNAVTPTYVELFAGGGGLSLGLDRAGWRCAGHAEIEPHARAVLRHHWPEVPLHGDVSTIDGTQWRGITLLSGGSPCQDLSIAGKRAGMIEGSGTRSSLFFEQVRLWHESEAPYCLWENVLGAFSSNDGRDFAAVLSAFVGGAVPVPSDGWSRAGVVRGPAGVAAWRVLDAQFLGVPQRRRRVFVLGARAGGVDPAEVLFGGELPVDAIVGGKGMDELRTRDGGSRNVDPARDDPSAVPLVTSPRYVTPKEAERLMGWLDGWTATGQKDDGTLYELKDIARYAIVGNGVASPVAHWIGLRLREAMEAAQ